MTSANDQEKRSLRDGFGEALYELGKENPEVVVLTADLSESIRTDKFEQAFPERFVQAGVAEQNMAGMAAGMALSGKIPFMTSFAVFNPGNNWNQIRTSICLPKANVKIIGSHAGFSDGPDGTSHQALEDIALTRVLPNLCVIVPGDYEETKKAVKAASLYPGPVYLRITRDPTFPVTVKDTSFEIGRAEILKEGDDVTLIFCGPIGANVLEAARKLRESKGIKCEVINCHTIKPLDEKTLLHSAQKTRKVITVEEHQVNGGLGSAVCELLGEKILVKVKRLGVKDSFGESGKYEELLKKHSLDKESLEKEILEFIGA